MKRQSIFIHLQILIFCNITFHQYLHPSDYSSLFFRPFILQYLRCLFPTDSWLYQKYKAMRNAGIYLVQVQIKTARFAILPQGEISVTLRVGRNSASSSFTNQHHVKGELNFNTVLQLNVDVTALETQRCSVTFNGSDKRILGIALISIPKDKNLIQSTYRLTQNEDKRAEIQLKIKISPFDSIGPNKVQVQHKNSESSLNNESVKPSQSLSKPLESASSSEIPPPKIVLNNLLRLDTISSNSNINLRSKISDQTSNMQSDDKKSQILKTFKVREQDKIIQIAERELKLYKDEKEAYYQLYQIEKAKNEVAMRFINNFLKKVSDKFPTLMEGEIEEESKKIAMELQQGQKRKSKVNTQQQIQADSAMIAQLQQANRSLHRQVEEYKKIVEQLRHEIIKNSKGDSAEVPTHQRKYSSNFMLPGLLDLTAVTPSRIREKSTIKPTPHSKEKDRTITPLPSKQENTPPPSQLKDIDFKKWIDLSIGQRVSIQSLLGDHVKGNIEPSQEKSEILIKKLKASFDKSFMALLAKKDLTKDALLSHKKEINRVFEEIVSF